MSDCARGPAPLTPLTPMTLQTADGLRVAFGESVSFALPADAQSEPGSAPAGRLMSGGSGPAARSLTAPCLDLAPAECLLVLVFEVPESGLAEFDDWFVAEHAQMLLTDSDWRRAQLLAPAERAGARVAVHGLAHRRALDGRVRAEAGRTPLTQRILSAGWFAPPRRLVFGGDVAVSGETAARRRRRRDPG